MAKIITTNNGTPGYNGKCMTVPSEYPLQTKTATPSSSQQVISPDSTYYGLSQVTVGGDANLAAANIKSGTSIFGVSGTYNPMVSGEVTPTTNGKITITHNLGHTPSKILIYPKTALSGYTGTSGGSVHLIVGDTTRQVTIYYYESGDWQGYENDISKYQLIYNFNSTSVQVGQNSTWALLKNKTYNWVVW